MSKVSQLTEITYPIAQDDTIYIVRGSTSYQGTVGGLLQGYLKIVPGFEGYLIIPANGNNNPAIVEEDDILIGKGAYYNGSYVMMRALQDSPSQDSEFATGISGNEF